MGKRRKRWSPGAFEAPAMGTPERKTDMAPPPEAHPPTPEAARELGRKEGRSSMLREQQQEIDAKIDQIRADAQALETTAHILDEIPAPRSPVPNKVETVQALFALAEGMRLAADRMPDSREIPF